MISYWKIENVYIVEVTVELYQDTLQKFLDNFSDEWLEFGYPVVDELLASKNNKKCTYMKKGFVLINIFL